MAEAIQRPSEQFQPIPVRLGASSRAALLTLLLPLEMVADHLTLALNLGSKDDPFGYSIISLKRG